MSLYKIRQLVFVVLVALVFGLGGYKLGSGELRFSKITESEVDTKLMNEVLGRLKTDYLKPEDIDSKKLMYGAASGVTESLGDPYTAFYPPKDNARSKEDLQGEFGGVGIQLGFVDSTLAVTTPLKGTPAERAGIKAGDFILRIKDEANKVDKDTSGITLEDAVNLIRGEKGTTVVLNIYREGEKQARDVSLVREVIDVPSTELEWLENGQVALISVNKFGEKTLSEWNKIVDEVVSKNAKGIVLDLRNNPGGYLQRAIDLAAEFVSDGVIVQQRDRKKTESFEVERLGRLIGKPLVVLVNRGSASAAEILSGALKERVGAKLVGEKTFGKGTVQEAQELFGGAGIHITIAEWLLPSGRNIHGNGIDPDVIVEYKANEKNPEADNQLDKALEVLREEQIAKK